MEEKRRIRMIREMLSDVLDFNNFKNINTDLFKHLCHVTDINMFNKFGEPIKRQITTEDRGFGLYAGEIFERFDERELIKECDINALLLFLCLIKDKDSVFLYNQKNIFESKIKEHILTKEQAIFYFSLKDSGMFNDLSLSISDFKDLEIFLLNELIYSCINSPKECIENSFIEESVNKYLLSLSNGFDLSEKFLECGLLYVIHKYTSESTNKELKKFSKYWVCLSKGLTERRLEIILNFHKQQNPIKVLILLMHELSNSSWKSLYDTPLKEIRLLCFKVIRLLLEKQIPLDDLDRLAFKNISTYYRFKSIYSTEIRHSLVEKELNNVRAENLNKVRNILQFTNASEGVEIKKINEVFKEDVLNAITSHPTDENIILSDGNVLFFTNKEDKILILKIVLLYLETADREKDKDIIDKVAIFIKKQFDDGLLKTDKTHEVVSLILFELRTCDGIQQIFRQFLTFENISSIRTNELIREYFIIKGFNEKSFGELVIDIANSENLDMIYAADKTISLLEKFLRTEKLRKSKNIDFVLFCLEVVLRYSEEYISSRNFLIDIIENEKFVELFNNEETDQKEQFIKFLDNECIDRSKLFQTEEEFVAKKSEEIRDWLGTYYSKDFIAEYNQFETRDKELLIKELSRKSVLQNFISRHTTTALAFIKSLIVSDNLDESAFWENI